MHKLDPVIMYSSAISEICFISLIQQWRHKAFINFKSGKSCRQIADLLWVFFFISSPILLFGCYFYNIIMVPFLNIKQVFISVSREWILAYLSSWPFCVFNMWNVIILLWQCIIFCVKIKLIYGNLMACLKIWKENVHV